VDVSRVHGELAVIRQGLTAGERVVTSGQLRVAEGVPLQILGEAR
jgi:multidrug efflux pump subunit AcrA (membrane-fusion protein)